VTPHPKTSGGARWSYLAAWGHALRATGSEEKARAFVAALYKNVPVLDAGARGAAITFSKHGIGDVLLAWESEALLAMRESGRGKVEIVVPDESIVAEPTVALLDGNVDRHGTREAAEAYLRYLYSEEGQEIVAKHHFRPTNAAVLERHREKFPPLALFTIDEVFGGWRSAQAKHFADGGEFDRITRPAR
jgi:sulfate transport system substrate-binding protein